MGVGWGVRRMKLNRRIKKPDLYRSGQVFFVFFVTVTREIGRVLHGVLSEVDLKDASD